MLTKNGAFQASCAGEFLTDHLRAERERLGGEAFGKICVWISPYYRTRQTAYFVLRELGTTFSHNPETGILSYKEDPSLIN